MSVIRVKHQKNYVVINKNVLEDPTLSFKAKGLWTYCMSRPDDWEFHVCHLATVSKDGEDAIYSAIKELEIQGYVKKMQRSEGGRFTSVDYEISEIKIILPLRDFPDAVFPDAENPALLSNDKELSTDIKKYPPPLVPYGIPLNGKRKDHQSPRQLGINPKALGTNPRALAINPRSLRDNQITELQPTKEEEEELFLRMKNRKEGSEPIKNIKKWNLETLLNMRLEAQINDRMEKEAQDKEKRLDAEKQALERVSREREQKEQEDRNALIRSNREFLMQWAPHPSWEITPDQEIKFTYPNGTGALIFLSEPEFIYVLKTVKKAWDEENKRSP